MVLSESKLITLLRSGQVAVIPTDTVYGLVCVASNQDAVNRLYQIKLRENKPGTVIAANLDQLIDLGLKARYLKAVEQYWPGAVSVVIPSHDLAYLHLGVGGIAVRIPQHETLQDILEQTGPLLTSSANLPGQPPANTIAEAQAYFGDKVDIYIDGGDLSGHQASTVIRVVDDAVEVLREGAVKIDKETGEVL